VIEALTTADSRLWDEALDLMRMYAFYHLLEYHRLAEMLGEGTPLMLVFRQSHYVIAFPLLVRDFVVAGDGPTFRDATTVRGFAGPLASWEHVPKHVCKRFQEELHDLLKERDIISVYARLNPITCPPSLLDGLGDIVEIGATVSLDLTPPPDVQISRYRKGHRSEINRLRRLGVTCGEASPESLGDFVRIYYDTMTRVRAPEEFYFDKDYFEFLLREMPGAMRLFLCRLDGRAVSGGIIGVSKGMTECYLAGTASEYVHLSPSKPMLDTMRQWIQEIGANEFHVGGGVDAQRDSLYNFKMGFGGREHVYSTWRYVVNQKAYDDVCRAAFQNGRPDGSFFPAYRSPSLQREVPNHAA